MTNPTSIDETAPVLAHHQIDIRAPLEKVWALHVDVNGWTRWNLDMTAARIAGSFMPGASFDWESYGFPVTSTIYTVDAPHRILWGGGGNGVTAIHEWRFTPIDGGVRVATDESFAGEAVVANVGAIKSLLDASLAAWLKSLKVAAESSATS